MWPAVSTSGNIKYIKQYSCLNQHKGSVCLWPAGVGSVLLPGQQQADGEPARKGGAGAGGRDWTGNHRGQFAG